MFFLLVEDTQLSQCPCWGACSVPTLCSWPLCQNSSPVAMWVAAALSSAPCLHSCSCFSTKLPGLWDPLKPDALMQRALLCLLEMLWLLRALCRWIFRSVSLVRWRMCWSIDGEGVDLNAFQWWAEQMTWSTYPQGGPFSSEKQGLLSFMKFCMYPEVQSFSLNETSQA